MHSLNISRATDREEVKDTSFKFKLPGASKKHTKVSKVEAEDYKDFTKELSN